MSEHSALEVPLSLGLHKQKSTPSVLVFASNSKWCIVGKKDLPGNLVVIHEQFC